jgi:hypothetical protein
VGVKEVLDSIRGNTGPHITDILVKNMTKDGGIDLYLLRAVYFARSGVQLMNTRIDAR